MTKTYQIHGAGCNNCLTKISDIIIDLPEVDRIVGIDMDSIAIRFKDYLDYVDINILNQAFGYGSYCLTVVPHIINFELVSEPTFEKL
jgi:hypothetical protein